MVKQTTYVESSASVRRRFNNSREKPSKFVSCLDHLPVLNDLYLLEYLVRIACAVSDIKVFLGCHQGSLALSDRSHVPVL